MVKGRVGGGGGVIKLRGNCEKKFQVPRFQQKDVQRAMPSFLNWWSATRKHEVLKKEDKLLSNENMGRR